jgi:hypothetical protein
MTALQPTPPPPPFPPGGTYVIPKIGDFTIKMMPRGAQSIDEMLEPVTWEEFPNEPRNLAYRNQLLGGLGILIGCMVFFTFISVMFSTAAFRFFYVVALLVVLIIVVGYMAFFRTPPMAVAVTYGALYFRYGKKKVNIFKWDEVENVTRVLISVPSVATSSYYHTFVERRIYFVVTKGGVHWTWDFDNQPSRKVMSVAREGFEDYYRERFNREPPPGDIPPPGTQVVKKPGLF